MTSTYRVHTNRCMTIILSMRYIFPLELIQIIIKLYWSLWSTPVLVLLTSDICLHCRSMIDIWYPFPLGRLPRGESILCKLTETYPDLRFVDLRYHKQGSDPHETRLLSCSSEGIEHLESCPSYMRYYVRWFPIMLLIPGPLWDHAIRYPKSNIELIDGVQVFNGTWRDIPFQAKFGVCHDDILDNGEVSRMKYAVEKPDGYIQWSMDALNNPEFIAAQNKLM
jgi:hypothetical protein